MPDAAGLHCSPSQKRRTPLFRFAQRRRSKPGYLVLAAGTLVVWNATSYVACPMECSFFRQTCAVRDGRNTPKYRSSDCRSWGSTKPAGDGPTVLGQAASAGALNGIPLRLFRFFKRISSSSRASLKTRIRSTNHGRWPKSRAFCGRRERRPAAAGAGGHIVIARCGCRRLREPPR